MSFCRSSFSRPHVRQSKHTTVSRIPQTVMKIQNKAYKGVVSGTTDDGATTSVQHRRHGQIFRHY